MSHTNSVLYSPYGAYELKSKYQRNFFFGTLITASFVFAIVLISWIIGKFGEENAINANPVVIKTIAELGPPPTIAKKPPQVKVNQPKVQAPKVGIPKPVADEDIEDEDVMLATREEMAEIIAPNPTDFGGEGVVVDIDDEDYLPSMDEFVAVEEIAEMIHQVKPKYPRMARKAGMTGRVWIKVLVSKTGSVLEAVIYKSCGTQALDDAALKVAKGNKFKPAIQNGRPVPMWVAYKVDFELDN